MQLKEWHSQGLPAVQLHGRRQRAVSVGFQVLVCSSNVALWSSMYKEVWGNLYKSV